MTEPGSFTTNSKVTLGQAKRNRAMEGWCESISCKGILSPGRQRKVSYPDWSCKSLFSWKSHPKPRDSKTLHWGLIERWSWETKTSFDLGAASQQVFSCGSVCLPSIQPWPEASKAGAQLYPKHTGCWGTGLPTKCQEIPELGEVA